MHDPVTDIIAQMQASKRYELLRLLAFAIEEMTLVGRSYYDDEDAVSHLRASNEEIHRLAGHLRDLCSPDEVFTESRAGAIREALRLLHPSAVFG